MASSNPQNAFKTEEFQASRAFEVINAADAYALGYTGLGQTVGILDTAVRIDHPELAGKSDLLLAGVSGTPTWDCDTAHGSHVAGIIAAKHDGVGMHGIAFDSEIWSGDFLNAECYLDLGMTRMNGQNCRSNWINQRREHTQKQLDERETEVEELDAKVRNQSSKSNH